MTSVVSSSEATLEAFCRAVLVTLVGSMIPALSISVYSSLYASKPSLAFLEESTFSTTREPSTPALATICLMGSCRALRIMSTPTCWSWLSPLTLSSTFRQRSSATPPPGTMPSSTAARVACRASSTRAFFSFISVSVAAPTLMTATPPTSLARRSWSFSRS